MIKLTSLTDVELGQLVEAFNQVNAALDLLEDLHLFDPAEGIDLTALANAVLEEHLRRQDEDCLFALDSAVAQGYAERCTAPDGTVTYRLTPRGEAYAKGLDQ